MDFSAIKAAIETLVEEQTWEALVALINTVLTTIFGGIADEEGYDY